MILRNGLTSDHNTIKAAMVTCFMIEFKYMGEDRYANVFAYRDGPCQFYIHIINTPFHKANRIVLQHTEGGMVVREKTRPVQEDLLAAICTRLEDYLSN
jgi:hypothetical protein